MRLRLKSQKKKQGNLKKEIKGKSNIANNSKKENKIDFNIKMHENASLSEVEEQLKETNFKDE